MVGGAADSVMAGSGTREYIEAMGWASLGWNSVRHRAMQSLQRSWAHRLTSQCRLCARWPAQALCEDCMHACAQPQLRCTLCAIALLPCMTAAAPAVCAECRLSAPPLSRCVAAVDYAFPWSRCIADFKFLGDPGWAVSLAEVMRHTPWAEDLIEGSDALLPVPMTASRLRARGFNQAVLLARALSAARTDASLLLRVADAQTQHALSRAERWRNLATVFAVEPHRAQEVAGRHLLLIDDVMTTGATLHAAAQALLDAGAGSVSALVLARTPLPGKN